MFGLTLALAAHAALSTSLAAPATLRTEHKFYGAMPTGVAVSKTGRIFATMPRWGDDVKATVVELKGGKEIPFPNAAMNDFFGRPAGKRFVSVQSVVIDDRDRLWALDTGSVKLGNNVPGLPRLWCIDLRKDKVVRVYNFPVTSVPVEGYLNDVRFDLTRGKKGFAFITDSSAAGKNGIVVLDLASGASWRRLADHPSTQSQKEDDGRPIVMPTADGYPLIQRPKPGVEKRPSLGADGIAIFPKENKLVFCPLIGKHYYSVAINRLIDRNLSDTEVAESVVDMGEKPGSDGLHELSGGRLLLTDYENAGVQLRSKAGMMKMVAQLPKYEWPDTLAVGPNERVYMIANQLQRQKGYHEGEDLRRKPYRLVSFTVPK